LLLIAQGKIKAKNPVLTLIFSVSSSLENIRNNGVLEKRMKTARNRGKINFKKTMQGGLKNPLQFVIILSPQDELIKQKRRGTLDELYNTR
jgi:hypothetical protein